MKEKSHVNDIDRSIYDIRDVEKDAFRLEEGLTEDIVRKISEEKNDAGEFDWVIRMNWENWEKSTSTFPSICRLKFLRRVSFRSSMPPSE